MASIPEVDFSQYQWVVNDTNYLTKWNNFQTAINTLQANINKFGAEAKAEADSAIGIAQSLIEAYNVNVLEPFKAKCTLGLDFAQGVYFVDDGTERIETTDPESVLTVERNTIKWSKGSDSLLNQSAINNVARAWNGDRKLGVKTQENQTNLILRNETFDGIPWNAIGDTIVTLESGVGNPVVASGDAVLFSTAGTGVSNRLRQSLTGLTAGSAISGGVFARAKPGGAGGKFRITATSDLNENDIDMSFEATEEWQFFPTSGVNSSSQSNFLIRESDGACDVYIFRAMLVESSVIASTVQTITSAASVGGDRIYFDGIDKCFNASKGTFLVKGRDLIKEPKTSHSFAFGGDISASRISVQAHRGRVFILGTFYNASLFSNGFDGIAIVSYDKSEQTVLFSYNGNSILFENQDFSFFDMNGALTIGAFSTTAAAYDSSFEFFYYAPKKILSAEANALTAGGQS